MSRTSSAEGETLDLIFLTTYILFIPRPSSGPTPIMSNTMLPRSASRCVTRAVPSFASRAPRIVARCLHQHYSPIVASSSRTRPSAQRLGVQVTAPAISISRRTMFIQTETTPNPDVRFPHVVQAKPAANGQRRSNSTQTSVYCQKQ
jgi:hypothetical protein